MPCHNWFLFWSSTSSRDPWQTCRPDEFGIAISEINAPGTRGDCRLLTCMGSSRGQPAGDQDDRGRHPERSVLVPEKFDETVGPWPPPLLLGCHKLQWIVKPNTTQKGGPQVDTISLVAGSVSRAVKPAGLKVGSSRHQRPIGTDGHSVVPRGSFALTIPSLSPPACTAEHARRPYFPPDPRILPMCGRISKTYWKLEGEGRGEFSGVAQRDRLRRAGSRMPTERGQKPPIRKMPSPPLQSTALLGPSRGLRWINFRHVATHSYPRIPAADNGRGNGCGGTDQADKNNHTHPGLSVQFTRKTPNVRIIAMESQIAIVAIVRAELSPRSPVIANFDPVDPRHDQAECSQNHEANANTACCRCHHVHFPVLEGIEMVCERGGVKKICLWLKVTAKANSPAPTAIASTHTN